MQMSRRFLPFVALFVAMALPLAAATLSAGSGSTSPGGSLEIALTFKAEGAQVTGVNFNLEYDNSALYITAREGAAAQAASKGLTCNEQPAGKIACAVFALNQNVIADGVLVQLSVQVKNNASGSYTLRLTNVAGTDASAKTVAVTGVNGSVTAGSAGNRPRITSVEHGTNFTAGIPAGGWVAIKGAGFMAGSGRIWKGDDFVGGKLPTRMDEIGVEVAGRPAYVYFISPGQLNVLAPMDETDETVSVRVTTPAGWSDSFSVRKTRFAPGFFMLDPEGRKYVIAQRHPDNTLIGKTSLYPGVTVPAKPGDVLMLYGTGFGQTNPPIVNGDMPVAAPLANPVTITIGGKPAQVLGALLVGAGQYQFNVSVPDLSDGDHAIIAEIGGVQSPGSAYLTVQR
jgi:uncharacterized protein (TIGR03437 family)